MKSAFKQTNIQSIVPFLGVGLAITALFVGTTGLWPWDHDEVAMLAELGVVPVNRYPGAFGQAARMHRLVPVWHALQNTALTVLPANEWGTRVLSSLAGAFVVLVASVASRRAFGQWFGWSVLMVVGGSSTLIWLSQQNRFYALALLWMTLAFIAVWLPDPRWRWDVVAVLCTAAAVLTHNLALVVFAFGALAGLGVVVFGSSPAAATRRAVLTGATAISLYLLYLRPLIAGWVSGTTGGTSSLVSFVAQTGILPIGLAPLGCIAAIRDENPCLRWWVLLCGLCLGFVATAPLTLGNWNPRYALLFMPPIWMLAAKGSAVIAETLAPKRLATWWFVAGMLVLAPKFGSHFIDGTRHDFRTAAHIVAARAPAVQVLSNWPAELQYYLQPATGQTVRYWFPGDGLPNDAAVVVLGSNAWEPFLSVGGRSVRVIGEIGRRRFDEQSHVVRVYLVDAPEGESRR
jgi:hypothetical protein